MIAAAPIGRQLGQKIAQYRKIMSYTQPQLAQVLENELGTKLTAQDVARMEGYGKANAANAKKKMPPSPEIIDFIDRQLLCSQVLDGNPMSEKGKSRLPISESNRQRISEVARYYEELGLLEDEEALEPSQMIRSLILRINHLKEKLDGQAPTDTDFVKKELVVLREERKRTLALIEEARRMISDIEKGKKVKKEEISELLTRKAV